MGSLGFLSPILVFLFVLFTSAETTEPSKLVDNICKQTSNQTFCLDALNSDPRARTPDVDNYLLAYISFGLAYINATDTSSQITLLLKNATTVRDEYLIAGLRKCGRSYKMAISATEEAYNDLNSETYSNLRDLASVAAQSAANCEGALNGTARPSLLTRRNEGLRGLCEICVVISNLFT